MAGLAPKELTPKSGALVFSTSRVLQRQLMPVANTALPFKAFTLEAVASGDISACHPHLPIRDTLSFPSYKDCVC